MNAFDKKINNEVLELAKLKQEKIAEMAKTNNAKAGEELDKEIEEINSKIQKIADDLGVDISEVAGKLDHLDEDEDEGKGQNAMKQTPYLNTKKSETDFFNLLRNSNKSEIAKNWKDNLVKNGVTIVDETLQLPKKIVEDIQTNLLNTNDVFPLFRVTSMGALIVSSTFESNDEAQVHVEGTVKEVQVATVTTSTIDPQLIYMASQVSEKAKRLTNDYAQLHDLVVKELTQMIVNKVVDLALIEGNGSNGFKAIATDDREGFVKHISSATTLVDGIEDAADFVRKQAGVKNLIVTTEQRKAILKELRALPGNEHTRIKNDDAEIASEVGVDKLIIYTGTKAIKPTVLVTNAYHVDMESLSRVEAFEWKTNENAILIESLSAGHIEKMYGAADITVATA
ncbi:MULTISPECIES: phage major capsid protein [unclassified Lactococcus]|uniref:phage major capsid protein n=1 Tax=unclassified Lactococcus TaxID=2643510 RepID=UPI0011C98F73|nr:MULTISPECIES: phage major capsid protein [unclassified Lactococcus]MQW21993.1 phage major capsid protein [Lactococcus sp. dk101]TXK36826.1 phage major capsid protein [Lactococcus sp. dk310]TXK47476.1 phage major capsid protein [Lactococcus sp. dk322]